MRVLGRQWHYANGKDVRGERWGVRTTVSVVRGEW